MSDNSNLGNNNYNGNEERLNGCGTSQTDQYRSSIGDQVSSEQGSHVDEEDKTDETVIQETKDTHHGLGKNIQWRDDVKEDKEGQNNKT